MTLKFLVGGKRFDWLIDKERGKEVKVTNHNDYSFHLMMIDCISFLDGESDEKTVRSTREVL